MRSFSLDDNLLVVISHKEKDNGLADLYLCICVALDSKGDESEIVNI